MLRWIRFLRVITAISPVLVMGCATTSAGTVEPDATADDLATSVELEQLLEELDQAGSTNPSPDGTRIAPQDQLEIVVFDAPELSQSQRVSMDGEIALPLLGVLPAAGLTAEELAEALETRLREKYMHDPHVSVQVTETRTRSVYVLGEVVRPGSFELAQGDRTTVLQAVAMGGGVSPVAAKSRAVLIRTSDSGDRTQIPVNLDHAMEGAGVDEPMLPNDILFVPRSTPQSIIRGALNAVTRIFTFRGIF